MSVRGGLVVDIERIVARSRIDGFLAETAKFYDCRVEVVDAEEKLLKAWNAKGASGGADCDQRDSSPIEVYGMRIGGLRTIPNDAADERSAATLSHRLAGLIGELAAREYELEDLSREIVDSYEEVNLFYGISSALRGARDVRGICQVILDQACRVIQVNRASILLLDERTGDLFVAAANGIPEKEAASVRVPIGQGISGRVMLSRTPRLVDDVRNLPRGLLRGEEAYASRSFISVPLCRERGSEGGVQQVGVMDYVAGRGGPAIGVVNMTDKANGREFTSGDLKLLTALANQAAVLIENVRLVEIENELKIARNIQQGLFPSAFPETPGIEIVGHCTPAHNVGGDYYDFFVREADGSIAVAIADVSGHNVSSALMMAVARSGFRNELRRCAKPGTVLAQVNSSLYDDLTRAGLFLSLFCLVLDPLTGAVTFANAGHHPAILRRGSDGSIVDLDADGVLVGVLEDGEYAEEAALLEAGDTLVLYTDGITEAQEPSGDRFGAGRLASVVEREGHGSAEHLLEAIFAEVSEFRAAPEPPDDQTAVVLKILSSWVR